MKFSDYGILGDALFTDRLEAKSIIFSQPKIVEKEKFFLIHIHKLR